MQSDHSKNTILHHGLLLLQVNNKRYTVHFDYDEVGRLFRTKYPNEVEAELTAFDRGKMGVLWTISNDGQDGDLVTTLDTREYDEAGRLKKSTYGNGIVRNWMYEASGLVSTIDSTDSVGDLEYTWDKNKNKMTEAITDTTTAAALYGFTSGTVYDNEDRLTHWSRANSAEAQSWELSKVGDWNKFTRNGTAVDRTHGSAHELSKNGSQTENVFYDAKGNITTIPANLTEGGASLTLVWDTDNHLVSVSNGTTTASYRYDALGRRVTSDFTNTAGKVFVHSGQQVIADYLSSSPITEPDVLYFYGSYVDEPIAHYKYTDHEASPPDFETYYYHQNQQFSTYALTSSSGAVVQRFAYTPYGQTTVLDASGNVSTSTPAKTRYLYTGRELDAYGLYYFRARYYSPLAGRFCSRDPIEHKGSEWNLYEFVRGRSLVSVDPSGKIVPILVGVGAGIGLYFCSPNIANAPGPGDPVYPDPGPLGSEPECILIGAGIGGAVGGGVVGLKKCCDLARLVRLARQLEQLEQQLQNIKDAIELVELALQSATQQLSTLPFGSDEWENQAENQRRAQGQLRRLNTTKRRLINEIIDLWQIIKSCS